MPSTTADRTRELTVEPAEFFATTIRASLDASRSWTEAYLSGVERAVEFQRRLVESYASAGDEFTKATVAIADRAGQVSEEVAKVTARTVEQTTTARAEVAKVTARTVEQATKAQAELVTGPTEEPLGGYDKLTAEQIASKLPGESQRTLAKVAAYEQAHEARATVLARVESLLGDEPAPGYDELSVADIQQLLSNGDEELAKRVRDYERSHAARNGVLRTAERQLKRS
jgi:hypothetical protein